MLDIKKVVLWFIVVVMVSCENKSNPQQDISVIPLPKEINLTNDKFQLVGDLKFESEDASLNSLQAIFDDYFTVFYNEPKSESLKVISEIDSNLSKEAYELIISKQDIILKGGSYQALAYGCTTLLQLIDNNNNLPLGSIKDEPSFNYRGLMMDLSRNWHDVSTLKQLISLCSWYKINYMQLHLTDDGLFTFPSTAFPKLASKNHYSLQDLEELNNYARARGVILVPEIDVPGHSSGFIRTMPELFGLKNAATNPYTLNMGKEEVYNALDTLFGEVAQAFPDSPYIHLGGDEVFTEGFSEDAFVQNYLKEHQLETNEDLYRHFLVRTAEIIKSKGKTTMLWSGFEREGKVEIPKNVVIMNWKPADYSPEEMIEDGYSIINASWQPLYVVNNRKWEPKTIYNWTPYDWKGFQTPLEKEALKAPESNQVLGGSIAVWEQNQYKAFLSLKERLPAISEKLWNQNTTSFDEFNYRLETTNASIESMLFPFELKEKGLTFENMKEPNFSENMWFSDTLEVALHPINQNINLHYTLDGSSPTTESPKYNDNISITKATKLSIQAFNKTNPIGQTLLKDYRLVPVNFSIKGLVNNLPPNSWDKHKFTDSMEVTLSSKLPGNIHYTTDNSTPTIESPTYKNKFSVSHSSLLRAKLFNDNDEQVGGERSDEYEKLKLETSLTTGKLVTTSNTFESGIPEWINNGKIARWDHWGAHTNGNNWVIIDLEEEQTINAFKVYTFWDDYRYYEYTIEVSSDNKSWQLVVDRSKNRELSTPDGQLDSIQPISARYLKLNLIRNSANPGLHLVEFQAY